MIRDPETREEWQEAADLAAFCLAIDSCRQYGLIQTDMKVRVARCERIVEDAGAMGIKANWERVMRLMSRG